MDSFPIHKNEQSMFFFFYTVSVSIYRRTNKKNWCTFPPVYVNKLFSHRQGSRVQVQYGGLQGTNKRTGMCANNNKKQVSWTNNSKVLMCTGTSMTQWPFQGSTLIPQWPFWGVLPLPFTCYCLSTPRGHWSENKSFSKKSLCGFPSVHVSVLTLHKQLLYWLWTRPGGSGKHYWRVPGTSRQSQFHLPQQKSQSSSYCSSLPSSAERAHYSSGAF